MLICFRAHGVMAKGTRIQRWQWAGGLRDNSLQLMENATSLNQGLPSRNKRRPWSHRRDCRQYFGMSTRQIFIQMGPNTAHLSLHIHLGVDSLYEKTK